MRTGPATATVALQPESTFSSLQWALRVGVFMCFLGHGSFGIIAKPEWTAFFGAVGIPKGIALHLMPFIGLHDLLIATIALASPRPIVLLWATIWCLWTAALRPLAGMGMWEFWERGGNYGIPLALLVLQPWPRSWREWVAPLKSGAVSVDHLRRCGMVLRISLALLLIGHAGFGAFQHKVGLFKMYEKAGFPESLGGIPFAVGIGWFELALAAAVLLKPFRSLLLFICIYKIASELLYPITGSFWWEFIERGGDYVAPIALILISKALASEPAPARMSPVFAPATTAP